MGANSKAKTGLDHNWQGKEEKGLSGLNGHKVRVVNRSSGEVILKEAEIASTFWKRLLGLLGKDFLEPGRGIIIYPCRSVHTVGMAFPIDVAFVDGEGRLCCILEKMRPGRFSPTVKEAVYAIEAPAGTFGEAGAALHDKIELLCCCGDG